MIIPFFGDQPFWAARVAEAKAGAHEVVPWKKLTAQKLAEGIKQCLTEEAQINVQKLAEGIEKEGDGAEHAVKSFHRSLPLAGPRSIRCSILEERVAVWQLKGSSLRLSALAAELNVEPPTETRKIPGSSVWIRNSEIGGNAVAGCASHPSGSSNLISAVLSASSSTASQSTGRRYNYPKVETAMMVAPPSPTPFSTPRRTIAGDVCDYPLPGDHLHNPAPGLMGAYATTDNPASTTNTPASTTNTLASTTNSELASSTPSAMPRSATICGHGYSRLRLRLFRV